MKMKKLLVAIFSAFFIIFIVAGVIMYKRTNELEKDGLESIIYSECVGVISSIDAEQASKYYFVNASRCVFGRAGREMLTYVQIGDSLIKYSDSTEVILKRYNDAGEVVFEKSFPIR